MQAVTSKGVTPASNGVDDICTAINNISTGGPSLAGKSMSYSLSSQFSYSRRLVSNITIPYIPINGVSSITTKKTNTLLESSTVKYRYRTADGTAQSWVTIGSSTYTLDSSTYPFIDIFYGAVVKILPANVGEKKK